MAWLIVSILISTAILFINEELSKQKKLSVELSRKIPHIVAGLAIASWSFFISLDEIAILGILFLLGTFVVRKFNLLPSSREVDRTSWGEPFFALGVTAAALISTNKWIFIAAVLHLTVADAVAALVGKSVGKRHHKVLGHNISTEGTLAFLLVSVAITAWVVFAAPAGLGLAWPVVIWLPLAATFTEAVLPLGLDNLVLPILVTLMLNSLQSVG